MCTENPISREHQYTAFINVRNTELAAYWLRYNIQAVLNLGLLVAALSAKSDFLIGQNIFFAPIVGLCLSVIWLLMTIWSKRLITKRWDKYIRQYEKKYSEELFQLFVSVEAEENKKGLRNKLKKHWNNLNILARIVPVILIIAWVFLGINTFINRPPSVKSQKTIIIELELENLNTEIKHLKEEIRDLRSKHDTQATNNQMKIPDIRK